MVAFLRGSFSTTSSNLLIASARILSLSPGCSWANFIISFFTSVILLLTYAISASLMKAVSFFKRSDRSFSSMLRSSMRSKASLVAIAL